LDEYAHLFAFVLEMAVKDFAVSLASVQCKHLAGDDEFRFGQSRARRGQAGFGCIIHAKKHGVLLAQCK
jgi:hypothetical protein